MFECLCSAPPQTCLQLHVLERPSVTCLLTLHKMPAHFNVMQLNIDLIAHRWVQHLCKKGIWTCSNTTWCTDLYIWSSGNRLFSFVASSSDDSRSYTGPCKFELLYETAYGLSALCLCEQQSHGLLTEGMQAKESMKMWCLHNSKCCPRGPVDCKRSAG